VLGERELTLLVTPVNFAELRSVIGEKLRELNRSPKLARRIASVRARLAWLKTIVFQKLNLLLVDWIRQIRLAHLHDIEIYGPDEAAISPNDASGVRSSTASVVPFFSMRPLRHWTSQS